MIYIESNQTDPYFNLALEEYVFSNMDKTKAYFMLWQNDNTIVVGKYQNTAEEVNQSYVDSHGIRVARRLSGGGAVYHDKGNLNFTFIMDREAADDFNFKVFCLPVINALKEFGIEAEFNGRNDITIDGKKFSGNSQYIKAGRVLHHGCIMVDSNLTNVADALNVKEAKFSSKSSKSVRSRVTTINANAKAPITMEAFKDALKRCAFEAEEMEMYTLTEEDLEAVERLREEKYKTWEWNYGFSPAYDMKRELKFPSGLVSAHLQVEKGTIKAVRFFGDFFGNGELQELEKAMEGLRLDESLLAELEKLDIDYYMKGIHAEELYELLR